MAYRGRVLLSLETVLDETPKTPVQDIISDDVLRVQVRLQFNTRLKLGKGKKVKGKGRVLAIALLTRELVTMRPSIARANEKLDPRCSTQTYHHPNQPH